MCEKEGSIFSGWKSSASAGGRRHTGLCCGLLLNKCEKDFPAPLFESFPSKIFTAKLISNIHQRVRVGVLARCLPGFLCKRARAPEREKRDREIPGLINLCGLASYIYSPRLSEIVAWLVRGHDGGCTSKTLPRSALPVYRVVQDH